MEEAEKNCGAKKGGTECRKEYICVRVCEGMNFKTLRKLYKFKRLDKEGE